jgi:hypothetical protein
MPTNVCAVDGCHNRARRGQTHCGPHIDEVHHFSPLPPPSHPSTSIRVGPPIDTGATAAFAAAQTDEDHVARLQTEIYQLQAELRQAQRESATTWDENWSAHQDLLGYIAVIRVGVNELKSGQTSIAKRAAAVEVFISDIKTEMASRKAEVADLKAEMASRKAELADLKAEMALREAEVAENRASIEHMMKALGLTKGALVAHQLMGSLEAHLVACTGVNEINRFDDLQPEEAEAALKQAGTSLTARQVGAVLRIARITDNYHARPVRGPIPDWETGLKHLLEIRGRIREDTIREVFRLALGPTEIHGVSTRDPLDD